LRKQRASALRPGFRTDIEVSGSVHAEKWPALFQLCSERFFSVLRIELRDGRLFRRKTDVANARKVAVINEHSRNDILIAPIRLAAAFASPISPIFQTRLTIRG